MTQSIPAQTQSINPFDRRSSVGVKANLASSSDFLSKILNAQIISSIESYFRTLSKMELEIIKYLNYYFKKFNGCIAIPVTNLMGRFKCSQSWIEKLLKRLYDKGILITTGGAHGRKVAKRTFTERGIIILKAVVKGFGAVKQDITKNSTAYCTDYSGVHTNYISSKVDISQGKDALQQSEMSEEKKKEMIAMARRALSGQKNE